MTNLNTFIQSIGTKDQIQISSFILTSLKPLELHHESPYQTKENQINYINQFINTISLIMAIGDIEHSGDWDPSIKIIFTDNTELETEAGYYIMNLQDDKILLENESGIGEQEDEDISYHILPISKIKSIQIIEN